MNDNAWYFVAVVVSGNVQWWACYAGICTKFNAETITNNMRSHDLVPLHKDAWQGWHAGFFKLKIKPYLK